MNRAALSAPSESIAPARWPGLFATTPTGRPSMRASAVTIPTPKSRRSSSTEPTSNSPSIAVRMSYALSRSTGTTSRSSVWSGDSQPVVRPWKYDRYCLATCDRFGLVGDDDVDDTVGALHLDRADRRRLEHAEAAALDHRRAAHADVRVLRGDHDVATAEDRRVAGEAVARRRSRRGAPSPTARRTSGRPGSRGHSRRARRCRPDARHRPR